MKKKRCDCGHIIDRHSHLNWHECKEDGCGCPGFVRTSIHSAKGTDHE